MAVSENEWQTRICKRIREQGGYAKKWASQFLIGVPDLIIICGEFKWFVEVKKIDCVESKPFKKRLNLTPKQRKEIQDIMESGGDAYVLVVFSVHEGTLKGKVVQSYIRMYKIPATGNEDLYVKDETFFDPQYNIPLWIKGVPWTNALSEPFILQLEKTIQEI